jgi:serine protease
VNNLATRKYRSIEVDSLVMPSGYLYTKTFFDSSYEYQSYGVDFTQSDSAAIPSSTTMGNCSDPDVFKVAIIDSGYKVNHPDSPCTTDDSGYTNCIGYSFAYNAQGDPDPWDAPVQSWHGTHVMGIIGSLGDNSPYSNVGSIPTRNDICYVFYRVFSETGGGASWSTIFAAVDSAVIDEKVNVINMSLGGGAVYGGQAYFDRAYAAGTLVVAASGNNGGWVYSYPASYHNVISVAAIDYNK